MSERYRALKVGPALDDLDVGPLVSGAPEADRRQLPRQDRARAGSRRARRCPTTCRPAATTSRPSLVADIKPDHELAQYEIFGPVQVVLPFDTEEEAIAIANGTEYGLIAGVWTADGGRQMRMARDIRAGQVFINNYGAGGGVELPSAAPANPATAARRGSSRSMGSRS